MKKQLFILMLVSIGIGTYAQTDSVTIKNVEELQAKIDKMDKKIVNLGVSIGYKNIWKKDLDNYQEAIISPIDTTLKIQNLDNGFVVLSTELIVNPFVKSTGIESLINDYNSARKNEKLKIGPAATRLALIGLQRLTLIASINLAEFQTAQSNFTFNKTIDGGLGIGFRLADNFWLAWTYEVTSHRQIRDYVKEFENDKIVIGGETITELDQNDNNLFYDKRLASNNFKFILKF